METTKIKDGKNLRLSHDYVAVDIYKDGVIESTPIYLQINKSVLLSWFDKEENRFIMTGVKYNGEALECRDTDGMEWISDVTELLTEVKIKK